MLVICHNLLVISGVLQHLQSRVSHPALSRKLVWEAPTSTTFNTVVDKCTFKAYANPVFADSFSQNSQFTPPNQALK